MTKEVKKLNEIMKEENSKPIQNLLENLENSLHKFSKAFMTVYGIRATFLLIIKLFKLLKGQKVYNN
jgi:hypothetical protein